MNHYSELINYIKQIAEGTGFVNTVAHGDVDDAFLDKGVIYPLFNIFIDSYSFSEGAFSIIYSVSLICVQQRDTNKEIENDRFYRNDNEIDNYNETSSILNRVWSVMYKDFCERNIIASESPQAQKIEREYKDILDGWRMDFEVELPNTTINICNDNPC